MARNLDAMCPVQTFAQLDLSGWAGTDAAFVSDRSLPAVRLEEPMTTPAVTGRSDRQNSRAPDDPGQPTHATPPNPFAICKGAPMSTPPSPSSSPSRARRQNCGFSESSGQPLGRRAQWVKRPGVL